MPQINNDFVVYSFLLHTLLSVFRRDYRFVPIYGTGMGMEYGRLTLNSFDPQDDIHRGMMSHRSHSAAPMDSPSLRYRGRSQSPTGHRSLSPPEHRSMPYSHGFVPPRYAKRANELRYRRDTTLISLFFLQIQLEVGDSHSHRQPEEEAAASDPIRPEGKGRPGPRGAGQIHETPK